MPALWLALSVAVLVLVQAESELFGSKEGLTQSMLDQGLATTKNRQQAAGFAVCVVVRNESPHIREWCAYHLVQGETLMALNLAPAADC
jgi:hypothetical protein